MEYKNICSPSHCTGCMACLASCNHNAIEIIEDNLGFRYPRIRLDRCAKCNLCYQTCPELHHRTLIFPQDAFAAAIDSSELNKVSSGGAASAFGQCVIGREGIVVGCSGKDMTDVHHSMAYSYDDLEFFRGSKYVQSKITKELLHNIRQELLQGKEVLFIGTPCQTAGLQNFLRKDYDRLTTVELICHGVPSQKILNTNISLYPNINPQTIKFREKIYNPKTKKYLIKYGWGYSTIEGTSHFIPCIKDPYMAGFLDLVTIRECCYTCRYAYSSRQSDLTIGDFWGLGKDSKFSDSCGVNLILVNTEKGQRFMKTLNSCLLLEPRSIAEAICGNGRLKTPPLYNSRRNKFIDLLPILGWSKAIKKTAVAHLKKEKFIKDAYALLKTIKEKIS